MQDRHSRLLLTFTETDLNDKGAALLTEQFDAEHEQLFTFKLDDGHEILMIRAMWPRRCTQAIKSGYLNRRWQTAGTTREEARILHQCTLFL